MKSVLLIFAILVVFAGTHGKGAAGSVAGTNDKLPPAPQHYFNDYAGAASEKTGTALNTRLKDFETATTDQVVVAIFRHKDSGDSLENYCTKVFKAWGVGQKGKNNGVVLFVFMEDRKMRIATGLGMEKILPDAECAKILQQVIQPRFKEANYDAGLRDGVDAILNAITQGEKAGAGAKG